ncbi:MAG: hypothetical protein HRT64_06710 [Erythrobacter sp.]|nr:hypothetical protein [Erythrobacter sp.]
MTRAIKLDGNIVSQIQRGMGSANGGIVFLYTLGGIIIGSNATIDVGNLGLKTAAPVTDGNGNFIANNQVQFQQSRSDAFIKINPGAQIDALNEGSYVALSSPQITQGGAIAVNGTAALVAGEAGTITFNPDGLFDIEVSVCTNNTNAIDHCGMTGGPGPSGEDDNHRAFLVAVPKNNAITLAINSGTQLGFDVDQSASMDGDVVVLSTGHNIAGGEIDATPTDGADAFLGFGSADGDFSKGIRFTSEVDGRARTQFGGFVTGDLTHEEDAVLSAGTIALGFGSNANGSGSLLAQSNLSLITDAPSFGQDVGVSFINLFENNTAQINGNFLVSSRGQFDANGNGATRSNFARVYATGGSSIIVGGDLIIDVGVDLRDDMAAVRAESGFAQQYVEQGSQTNISGVTRILSDA